MTKKSAFAVNSSAGDEHARFNEDEVASVAMLRCRDLLGRTIEFIVGKTSCLILALAAFAIPAVSSAEMSITVDGVSQRWPWNNKVDIRYTITDGQNVDLGVYCKVVFTANIGGTIYTIDGLTNMYANASSGSHVATWLAPDGIDATGCTMTASLVATEVPSGNDYMIIDLDTGTVAYEALVSQDAANARYKTQLYKTSKMVLRKVPKTADSGYPNGYRTGYSGYSNYNTYNSPHDWITDKDYYIGVFMVTQAQYSKICGTNPSKYTAANTVITDDVIAHRPVESVLWIDLRGADAALPTNVVTPKADGGFLQRLNYLTQRAAGMTGFDLPTEIMFEIAQRAGSTSLYAWGDTASEDYAVCKQNSGAATSNNKGTPLAVGSKLPNDWGLYDTTGNVYEWMLDDADLYNLASATDPFTPNWNATRAVTTRFIRGGGCFINNYSDSQFHPSWRHSTAVWKEAAIRDAYDYTIGLRVAYVVK